MALSSNTTPTAPAVEPVANYAVEFFFPAPPLLDADAFLMQLRAVCGDVVVASADASSLVLEYRDHTALLSRPTTPRCIITVPETPTDLASYEPALQQTWDWPEARAVLQANQASIIVLDDGATGLHYKTRLELILKTVTALVEALRPQALYWEPCQKFVEPGLFLQSRQSEESYDYLFAAINVRMFNLAGRSRPERVMDTLGLGALGLPDFQCHFAGLDPQAVGHLLYEYAYLLFDKGDVIEEGHTVQGLEADAKWRCRREAALVEPPRAVTDVDPGQPHAGLHRKVEIAID